MDVVAPMWTGKTAKTSESKEGVYFLGRHWTVCWWRRGESNPRPQALDFRIYARSWLFFSHPTLPEQQGRRQTSDGVS